MTHTFWKVLPLVPSPSKSTGHWLFQNACLPRLHGAARHTHTFSKVLPLVPSRSKSTGHWLFQKACLPRLHGAARRSPDSRPAGGMRIRSVTSSYTYVTSHHHTHMSHYIIRSQFVIYCEYKVKIYCEYIVQFVTVCFEIWMDFAFRNWTIETDW